MACSLESINCCMDKRLVSPETDTKRLYSEHRIKIVDPAAMPTTPDNAPDCNPCMGVRFGFVCSQKVPSIARRHIILKQLTNECRMVRYVLEVQRVSLEGEGSCSELERELSKEDIRPSNLET